MTIAVVAANTGGALFDAQTSVSRAFPQNVVAGSLISVVCWRDAGASDPWAAGDCTKSAGTATLGTITLDAQVEIDNGGGLFIQVGIWSAIVTGSGSLTMRVENTSSGYGGIGSIEATGNWDSSRVEDTSTASTQADDQGSATSGNATSAGAALFVGGLVISGSVDLAPLTEDSPFGLIFEVSDNSIHLAGSATLYNSAGALTDAASWTMAASNSGNAAALVVYKEAAAPPAIVTPMGGRLYLMP